jgi:hypothetical protein
VAIAGQQPSGQYVSPLIGEAPASPAGPVEAAELDALRPAPPIPLPRVLQGLRFNQRQIEFVLRARRELGDVFRMRGTVSGGPVITCHPESHPRRS